MAPDPYTAPVPHPARQPFLSAVLFGLLHALIFGASFAPLELWPLAPFSIVPLIFVALKSSRPVRSALGAMLGAAPFWAYTHLFVWKMSEAGVFPLVAYLSMYQGLFVLGLAWLHKRLPDSPMLLLVPVVWTGLEVLRGEVLWDGYAWYLLSHPLIESSLALVYAALFGAYGVSAGACVFIGWCIDLRRWTRTEPDTRAYRKRSSLLGTVGASMAGAVLLAGGMAPGPVMTPQGKTMTLGLIQTNVPQDNRGSWSFDQRQRDFESFLQLTRQAAQQEPPPDLILWPETMFPGLTLSPAAIDIERSAGLAYPGGVRTTEFVDRLLDLQRELGVPLFVGAQGVDGLRIDADPHRGIAINIERQFNSVFMLSGGAIDPARYDKIHLTPFGEVMPYISQWEWLERQVLALGARGMSFGLKAGAGPVRFEVLPIPRVKDEGQPPVPIRVATPICYEVAVAHVCRRLVFEDGKRRADLLASPSNDGWFDRSDAQREHLLLLARWRCAELRTPMVRAANTGLSAFIDESGRILEGTNPQEEAALVRTVGRTTEGAPLYAHIGDSAGWLCLLSLAGLLIRAGTARRGPVGAMKQDDPPGDGPGHTPGHTPGDTPGDAPAAPAQPAPVLRLAGDAAETGSDAAHQPAAPKPATTPPPTSPADAPAGTPLKLTPPDAEPTARDRP